MIRLNAKTSGGSGINNLPWKYSATNYTDLTTVVAPTADEKDLAIVYNSQGIWLINRKIEGVYIYKSGTWEYADQELQDQLQTTQAAVDLNTTHRESNGSDHTFINQNVTSGSSPTFNGENITGVDSSFRLVQPVRKGSPGTILKGTPIYVSGFHIGSSSTEVEEADNDSLLTMPAFGLAPSDFSNSANVDAILAGKLFDVDTSPWPAKTELWVSGDPGTTLGLTDTKPSGSKYIQKIATVLRSHAANGVLSVFPGRTNDLPNIAAAKIWLGNSLGVPTEVALSGAISIDDAGNVTINPGVVNLSHLMKPLDHTATENEDDAIQLSIDAAGFSNVRAIETEYKTGAIGASQDEEVYFINVDEDTSTGGRVSGYVIVSTDLGAARVDGLEVGVQVNPVTQSSGIFGDADLVDDNGTDETVALSSGGAGNVAVFTNDNETLTIANAAKFGEIEVVLGTGASNPGILPTFEYSTGVGTWASFFPIDGTNQFRFTGTILWLLSDIPSWATGAGGNYLIRVTRTRNTISTTPILDLVQISETTAFCWGKEGNVVIKTVELGLGEGASDNRKFLVDSGLLKAVNPSDVEGRYISEASLEKITNSSLADMTANSVKLNNAGSAGPATNLVMPPSTFLARLGAGNIVAATTAQATALLDLFTSSLKGLVPSSGGGTTNFLRADGTWANPIVQESSTSDGVSSTGSTSYVNKMSLTFTAVAGDYLILWSADTQNTSGIDTHIVRIQEDNTTNLSESRGDDFEFSYVPFSGMAIRTLSAASHTFDIDYGADSGFGTTDIKNARIFALQL